MEAAIALCIMVSWSMMCYFFARYYYTVLFKYYSIYYSFSCEYVFPVSYISDPLYFDHLSSVCFLYYSSFMLIWFIFKGAEQKTLIFLYLNDMQVPRSHSATCCLCTFITLIFSFTDWRRVYHIYLAVLLIERVLIATILRYVNSRLRFNIEPNKSKPYK